MEQPGIQYNPLVLVGPTGVGKTHLLHALGHGLAGRADALVACLSAQGFLDELVKAIHADKVDVWRSRFRRVTALLVDDLHLLAGKQQSQEELFHLFNALAGDQRQLAFTLPTPPREVSGLDDRLVSRLEGGLVANLDRPDRDLRREVIVRKLRELTGEADEELADYLAARVADSVRAVLGLVQRVMSAADSQGVEPTAGPTAHRRRRADQAATLRPGANQRGPGLAFGRGAES